MIVSVILLITLTLLSLGSSTLLLIFCGWWDKWYMYIVSLLIALGLFGVLFILFVFVIGVFLSRYTGSDKDYKPNRFFQWILGEICLVGRLIFRIRWNTSGFENIPDEPCMIVSNHLSIHDHICLVSALRHRKMVCIHKKPIADIFLIGGIVKKAGYLAIIQKDIKDGTRVIGLASEYIKNGTSVCVAPEGTRNKEFPEQWVLPFKGGTFAMAVESKCPIVVIGLQNTNAVVQRWPLHSTHVYADVVGVLRYEDYKDLSLAQIADKTRQLILDKFEEKEARFYHLRPKKK